MDEIQASYVRKAGESLEGAENEFANGRYNHSASRSYDACYQTTIGALVEAGVKRMRGSEPWRYRYV